MEFFLKRPIDSQPISSSLTLAEANRKIAHQLREGIRMKSKQHVNRCQDPHSISEIHGLPQAVDFFSGRFVRMCVLAAPLLTSTDLERVAADIALSSDLVYISVVVTHHCARIHHFASVIFYDPIPQIALALSFGNIPFLALASDASTLSAAIAEAVTIGSGPIRIRCSLGTRRTWSSF